MPYISDAKFLEMKIVLKLARKQVEQSQKKLAELRQQREQEDQGRQERY